MKVFLVLVVLLTGCSQVEKEIPRPVATTTVPTTVAEAAFVDPLMGIEPCALVDKGVRERWGVGVEGFAYTGDGERSCTWEEDGASGIGLSVSVKPGGDPLEQVQGRGGQRDVVVGGFAGVLIALEPDMVCEIWVRTAPGQGFKVLYGALDQVVDACGGAWEVAEGLAARVRAG
ncbi:DUF3558 family protein [Actinokineospora sp. NPDC004072]